MVNALSDRLEIAVGREGKLYTQSYCRGKPKGKLAAKAAARARGTAVTFHPDAEVFGEDARLRPARLYAMAASKAYLFGGVEIRWRCDPACLGPDEATPATAELKFPGGLAAYVAAELGDAPTITPTPFAGKALLNGDSGRVEWAMAWTVEAEPSLASYCNMVPTPEGGTHEAGFRGALTKSLKAYGELVGNRRAPRRSRPTTYWAGPPGFSLDISHRAAVPRPDQGAAGQPRGRAAGRGRRLPLPGERRLPRRDHELPIRKAPSWRTATVRSSSRLAQPS